MADRWIAEYAEKYSYYEEAAQLAKQEIENALTGRPISIHSIVARAKTPGSAAAKIKRKGYGRPSMQMTDVMGVRVITSYAAGIEEVVGRLRARYVIDEQNSIDKRRVLGDKEFGYRSVHLIVTIGKVGALGPAGKILSRTKIEVQVRSIIEHAWAEAEHVLRYKSGAKLPDAVRRRFGALAGALEIIDRELDSLAASLVDLVTKYEARYRSDEDLEAELDSARLLALLAVKYPESAPLGPRPLLLPFQSAAECVSALLQSGVRSAGQLLQSMDEEQCRTLVRSYADERGIEPEVVSALVRVGAVVGLANAAVLADYPDLNDAILRRLINE